MTREMAFAMCVLDENEFARSNLPDLAAKSFYMALGYEVLAHKFFGEEETVLMQRKLRKSSTI